MISNPSYGSGWDAHYLQQLLTSSMHVSNVTLFQAISGFKNPNQGLDRIDINYKLLTLDELDVDTKGSIHYIFPSLFNKSKGKHLWNKDKCFLFHFESSFRSWDDQILTFQIFKCHEVIVCPNMKHFIE